MRSNVPVKSSWSSQNSERGDESSDEVEEELGETDKDGTVETRGRVT